MATLWCVLHKDVEQGDDFVNGPFPTEQEAIAFAAVLMNEFRADDEGRPPLDLDVSQDGRLIQLLDNGDVVREALVQELIQPNSKEGLS